MLLGWNMYLVNPPSYDATASYVFASLGYIQSHQLSHYSSSLFTPFPLLCTPLITQNIESGQQIVPKKKVVVLINLNI
jgi:hypothetical protein